jgi:excisionase family DNA binding protein
MQASREPHARPEQLTLCIWESEITPAGDGRAVITARKPLSRLSTKQAARILGCTEWTVRKLFRLGLLSGWKPGAARRRRDGQPSNASLVLDAESVLRYKESVSRQGAF